jgi:hypothetical protein
MTGFVNPIPAAVIEASGFVDFPGYLDMGAGSGESTRRGSSGQNRESRELPASVSSFLLTEGAKKTGPAETSARPVSFWRVLLYVSVLSQLSHDLSRSFEFGHPAST